MYKNLTEMKIREELIIIWMFIKIMLMINMKKFNDIIIIFWEMLRR